MCSHWEATARAGKIKDAAGRKGKCGRNFVSPYAGYGVCDFQGACDFYCFSSFCVIKLQPASEPAFKEGKIEPDTQIISITQTQATSVPSKTSKSNSKFRWFNFRLKRR